MKRRSKDLSAFQPICLLSWDTNRKKVGIRGFGQSDLAIYLGGRGGARLGVTLGRSFQGFLW